MPSVEEAAREIYTYAAFELERMAKKIEREAKGWEEYSAEYPQREPTVRALRDAAKSCRSRATRLRTKAAR